MAELKYCPHCEESQEATKKGFNKDNEQLWICKVCNKRFVEVTNPRKKKPSVAKTTKSVVVPKKRGTTEISVNNNVIKTVPGLLTLDEAFEMVSSYFKEIAKDKAEITERDDKKTIKFKIQAGSKG